MSTDTEYEWFDNPNGKYRLERSRFGTFTSIDEQGERLITGLTEEAVHHSTAFHMQGMKDGFLKEEKSYSGEVGGKL